MNKEETDQDVVNYLALLDGIDKSANQSKRIYRL